MSSGSRSAVVPGTDPVARMTEDELIIRLMFTINHLSRWLTPVHDDLRLRRSPQREIPSVKDLLLRMRDHELDVFPQLYAIANSDRPDLYLLPRYSRTEEERQWDRSAAVLSVMSEVRRLRQSTGSLLRSLPNDAWRRDGLSRTHGDTTVRRLADELARHDAEVLGEMDRALKISGARQGISAASKASLEELMELPV